MDSGSSGSSKKDPNPTKADIRQDFTTLYITNLNDYTWESPKIYINGIMRGYQYQWSGSVRPFEKLEIGLLNFTKRNGERFQTNQRRVTEVIVSVDGHDSNIYNF